MKKKRSIVSNDGTNRTIVQIIQAPQLNECGIELQRKNTETLGLNL